MLEFKSDEENYIKEKSGLKPNTVREIDLNEDKFQELENRRLNNCYGRIKITNARYSDGHDYFIREITDITLWKNLSIISWEH